MATVSASVDMVGMAAASCVAGLGIILTICAVVYLFCFRSTQKKRYGPLPPYRYPSPTHFARIPSIFDHYNTQCGHVDQRWATIGSRPRSRVPLDVGTPFIRSQDFMTDPNQSGMLRFHNGNSFDPTQRSRNRQMTMKIDLEQGVYTDGSYGEIKETAENKTPRGPEISTYSAVRDAGSNHSAENNEHAVMYAGQNRNNNQTRRNEESMFYGPCIKVPTTSGNKHNNIVETRPCATSLLHSVDHIGEAAHKPDVQPSIPPPPPLPKPFK